MCCLNPVQPPILIMSIMLASLCLPACKLLSIMGQKLPHTVCRTAYPVPRWRRRARGSIQNRRSRDSPNNFRCLASRICACSKCYTSTSHPKTGAFHKPHIYIVSANLNTASINVYVCIIYVPIFVSNRILISPRSWNKKSQQPTSNVIYQSKHIALLNNMKRKKVPGVPSGANSVKCFVLAPHPS